MIELTQRQRQVWKCIANGDTAKEGAWRLGVALKTFEYHRSKLFEKLGTHSIALLTKLAIRQGLTKL